MLEGHDESAMEDQQIARYAVSCCDFDDQPSLREIKYEEIRRTCYHDAGKCH